LLVYKETTAVPNEIAENSADCFIPCWGDDDDLSQSSTLDNKDRTSAAVLIPRYSGCSRRQKE
jgi:hypothetical protein